MIFRPGFMPMWQRKTRHAAESGIGFLIMQSTNIIAPAEMFVGFLMLGSFGLITDQLFRMTIHRLMRRYMIPLA